MSTHNLREYEFQEDIIKRASASLDNIGTFFMFVDTGLGKTYMATRVWLEKKKIEKDLKLVIVSPKTLHSQWAVSLSKLLTPSELAEVVFIAYTDIELKMRRRVCYF